jgi:hypothetical protein
VTTDPLFVVPSGAHTRWASPENPQGRKGGACANDDGRKRLPCVPVPAGASRVLLDLAGTPGVIRRIWVTISDRSALMLRGLKLEAFWDGASRAAISAPLGDFFSLGLGRMTSFQSALFSSPEGRSFLCFTPMPFRRGARLVLTNESGVDLGSLFYDVDFTVGDRQAPTMAYLHAHWRRESPTTAGRDYEILPRVHGRGRFLGCNVGVIADTETWFTAWWGEGEVKVYIDGDTDHATLCGTGTEDYIGSGWGQGQYSGLYQGCHVADHESFRYCFYRLHVPDPVWFHRDLRVTIQQIGCWDPQTLPRMAAAGRRLQLGGAPIDVEARVAEKGYGLFERQDDWSSCAWFYLASPTNDLPPLPAAAERTAGLA